MPYLLNWPKTIVRMVNGERLTGDWRRIREVSRMSLVARYRNKLVNEWMGKGVDVGMGECVKAWMEQDS